MQGSGPDASTDIDAPIATFCIGNAKNFCMQQPTGVVQLTTAIDTKTSPLCTSYAQSTDSRDDACLIAGDTIVVSGSVRVTGTRPLVLAAATSIQVMGTLDVASHVGQTTGAGASSWRCANQTMGTPPGSLAGGAGGSHRGLGGAGGASGTNLGGTARAAATVTVVRGGCAGQVGDPNSGTALPTPGAGGGAVYLVAGASIDIAQGAIINASGAGTLGGPGFNGAGVGGGAGGMIGLDAPAISSMGTLIANGGGGSGGFDFMNPVASGFDPDPAQPFNFAQGGFSPGAGNGGNGSAGTFLNGFQGQDIQQGINGGGGGGGAGFIVVVPATQRMNVRGNVTPPISP